MTVERAELQIAQIWPPFGTVRATLLDEEIDISEFGDKESIHLLNSFPDKICANWDDFVCFLRSGSLCISKMSGR